MRERPILFSGEMVRAILEGKKTQTRRVLNRDKLYNGFAFDDPRIACACPYGQPGDRLWVRETFAPEGDAGACWYRAGIPDWFAGKYRGWLDYPYKLDRVIEPPEKMVWKPSIFMPRWASRITLEVTGVRVERIQDISYEDCCRETGAPLKWEGEGEEPYPRQMKAIFRELWNSINLKRGYGWAVNPWCWVVEFKSVGT